MKCEILTDPFAVIPHDLSLRYATVWTKCVTTNDNLMHRLVKTFANHFCSVLILPHVGHPTRTRYIYLASDSEVGSEGVNQIHLFKNC